MKWAQLAWANTCVAFSTTFALLFLGPSSPAWPWVGAVLVITGIGACVCVALAMASFIDEIERLRLLGQTTRPTPLPELPEAS